MRYLSNHGRLAATLACALMLLAGCGGGGGGGSSDASSGTGLSVGAGGVTGVGGGSGSGTNISGSGSGSGGTSTTGSGGTTVTGSSDGSGAGLTGSLGAVGTTSTSSTGAASGDGSSGSSGTMPVGYTPAPLASSPPAIPLPTGGPVPTLAPGPHVLVLYDAPDGSEWQKLGFSYAIMLRNLLGHFNAQVDLEPVQQYAAGQLDAHDDSFYIGAAYANPLPAAFLADAAATTKTLVWFKYNLWELMNNPGSNFGAAHGFSFTGLRGLNALPTSAQPQPGFFDTVTYKGMSFVKYYAWDQANNVVNADPDIGVTAVTDPTKAQAVVPITDAATGEQAPYVLHSGNFWYVADMPFSYIGPRDRYLVICDLLHDMLGIYHAERHLAMVRLEDVDADVSVATVKTLTDYLAGQHIPFSIAAIPHYMDPLGIADGTGVPQNIPLAQATNLKRALDYAITNGGAQIVMHGYTHQYAAMKNPWSAVSADDYEFWNIVNNSPVAEDSTPWALGRLWAGLGELVSNGYNPVAWETPHYVASATDSRAFTQVFNTTYQRVVYFTADQPDFSSHPGKDFAAGQIFPYPIATDYYGQRVLPEDLGNIEYDISKIDPSSNLNYSWQDILLNARYALTVRDGYASFFFHPFWLEPQLHTPGFADFQSLVGGITQLGYTWVAPTAAQ